MRAMNMAGEMGKSSRMQHAHDSKRTAIIGFSGKMALKAAFLGFVVVLAACNAQKPKVEVKAELDTAPKFTEAQMQVKESPRVTEARNVPKGGGRYSVGKPYKIRGKWYKPVEDATYAASGKASWYGPNFHGRLTANGEIYNQYGISAAHPTMPLPSYARVTNLDNGSSVIVRVNDRGPYAHGRIIDLSGKAAELLGYRHAGVADVRVEYVGKAQLDGHDERFLLASYRAPGTPEIVPGATQPGTMIAMADEPANPVADAIEANSGEYAPLLAYVPIPTPRPAYFNEGTPMQMARSGSLKLGYASEDEVAARFAAAFDAVDNNRSITRPQNSQVDKLAASTTAVVLLGQFEDHDAAAFVRQQFSDIGLVSARQTLVEGRQVLELTMLTGADAVESVLAIARERGIVGATRIAAR